MYALHYWLVNRSMKLLISYNLVEGIRVEVVVACVYISFKQ